MLRWDKCIRVIVREEIDGLSVIMYGLWNGSSPIWFWIDVCLSIDIDSPNEIAPPTVIASIPRTNKISKMAITILHSRERERERELYS